MLMVVAAAAAAAAAAAGVARSPGYPDNWGLQRPPSRTPATCPASARPYLPRPSSWHSGFPELFPRRQPVPPPPPPIPAAEFRRL